MEDNSAGKTSQTNHQVENKSTTHLLSTIKTIRHAIKNKDKLDSWFTRHKSLCASKMRQSLGSNLIARQK